MFKCDHKIIKTCAIALLMGTSLFASQTAEKTALDGGMTYKTVNGVYADHYRVNDQGLVKGLNHGRAVTKAELKAWNTDIMPDGTGLPEGKGSVEMGDELYEEQCAMCHGDFGAGGAGYPTLTGGNISSLKNQRIKPGMDAPKRTIGTYWPQASTLLWYIRDAMPYAYTKSLSNDELYAITAFLLAQNGITVDGEEMEDEFVLSKENFLKIKLPNEDGFYPNIDGKEGVENMRKFYQDPKNFGAQTEKTRCMKDCKDDNATVMRILYEMKDVIPSYSTKRDIPE